jgi:hypothetical protein
MENNDLTLWKVMILSEMESDAMTDDAMNENQARAALNAANQKLREQLHWPLSRHAAAAAVMGAMVAAQGFDVPISTALMGATLCALAAIVAADRAKRGVWISAWQGARWVTAIAVTIAIAGMFLSLWFNRNLGASWASFALGAAVFVVTFGLSLAWERVYRHELRSRS